MTIPSPPTEQFAAPDFSGDLDVDAVIARVPPTAQIKGFFVKSYERMVVERRPDLADAVNRLLPRARFTALTDLPRADVLRIEVEIAKLLNPGVPLKEALRRSTLLVYPTFMASMLGRVLLATLGRNVDAVLAMGPRMFSSVTNYGHVEAAQLGPRHWRYHYRDYYSWLDCGDVGVIEGLLLYYGKAPSFTLAMNGPFEMWLDIQWTDRVEAVNHSRPSRSPAASASRTRSRSAQAASP